MIPFVVPQDARVPRDSLSISQSLADSSAAADSLQSDSSILSLTPRLAEAQSQLIDGQWEEIIKTFYTELTSIAATFIPRLASALFVLFLFYLLFRFSSKLLRQLLHRSKHVDAGLEGLLTKTYAVVAWIFIGIMVLAQFGINVTALLAGLSVAGIAVGFAAQDTLQNFIAGITILTDRPFRIGHFVEVDQVYGQVEEITLRSTRVRTPNNEVMVMPNSLMINQKLVNHSLFGVLRIEIPFGIAYKEFPQEARDVVLAIVKGDERLHPDYTPDVVVTSLNDSSVDMKLRLHISDSKLAVPMKSEYTERIREALRDADIEIPFPHLQLFIDEAKAFPQGGVCLLYTSDAADE